MSSDHEQKRIRTTGQQYLVVARRYRPKAFEELIGQQHVATALTNAIRTDRVGHAYLFAGARGIGKTSAARILAKCLNCETGLTPVPCNRCDACEGIAAGEDVDVLEIDGASNRGIDEIRQLRSNIGIRAARSRFKIYIIDEVHMLTTQAFNALLKTLEEPPEHVKFIFCTTDPEKIPVTVLSRCQRFDFAPVRAPSMVERLRQIVDAERVEADVEALELLARRAGGSMRDSQSLLEQLLAFGDQRITVDTVHQMLGTADVQRVAQLVQMLIKRHTAQALVELDQAIGEGVDAGQLAEQLLGYFRDMMAAAVGCGADLMLHTGHDDYDRLVRSSKDLGLDTALAAAQILDQTLTQMRSGAQARTLLEMALIRIGTLEDFTQLSMLIAQLKNPMARADGLSRDPPRGERAAPSSDRSLAPEKKSDSTEHSATDNQPSAASSVEMTDQTVEQIWQQALANLGDMTAEFGNCYERIAISAPNQLVVSFKEGYTHQKEACDRPDRKLRLEEAVSRLTGREIRIDFQVVSGIAPRSQPSRSVPSGRQRMRETERHPLVQEAIDVFDAEVLDIKMARPTDD